MTSAGRARRSPPPTRRSPRSGSSAGASATSSRTAPSTFQTTSSPSSSGCRSACTPASAGAAKALTDRVVEAMRHPAASCLSHPKGRILNHRPENALDLDRVFEVALETRRRAGGERPTRQARPRGKTCPRGARRRRQDRLLDRCSLGARSREHGAVRRHRAARRGRSWRNREHAAAGETPKRLKLLAPRAAYSRTSYQCVSRSAAATSGSVCAS